MMLLIKMFLIEILLDVIDEEIYYVVKDVYCKVMKVFVKQLVQFSVLVFFIGFGGLGGYGLGDSEDERSDRGFELFDIDDEELWY